MKIIKHFSHRENYKEFRYLSNLGLFYKGKDQYFSSSRTFHLYAGISLPENGSDLELKVLAHMTFKHGNDNIEDEPHFFRIVTLKNERDPSRKEEDTKSIWGVYNVESLTPPYTIKRGLTIA